jgi:hypothetical protein
MAWVAKVEAQPDLRLSESDVASKCGYLQICLALKWFPEVAK